MFLKFVVYYVIIYNLELQMDDQWSSTIAIYNVDYTM